MKSSPKTRCRGVDAKLSRGAPPKLVLMMFCRALAVGLIFDAPTSKRNVTVLSFRSVGASATLKPKLAGRFSQLDDSSKIELANFALLLVVRVRPPGDHFLAR